ncbi:MAG: hypothetical protein A2X67_01355 [Ignavibacteria bacterium GWA2_55_11]|nr:MAG: hypothetical protein A2X67_01355 [Ignavibacteria bacterium GWA2_55_11]OGU44662.1 MAG: hypothetical protein A2X68_08385 [Ignavibacteria bacterium GWC2_56_12]
MANILLMIDEATVGGGQQHVYLLSSGLSVRGHRVFVACPPAGFLPERLSRIPVSHIAMQLSKGISWSSMNETLRVVRSVKPDIVHTHGGFAGVYGRLAARNAGVRGVVHTYHGLHYLHFRNVFKRTAFRAADRALVSRTDATICVSESDAELALRARVALRARNHVILNGIDVAEYSQRAALARSSRSSQEKLIVGTVGRLHVQKGHVHFLDAAAAVLRERPDVEFWIAGDGPQHDSLVAHARALEIADSVRFLGTRLDIPELLAQMDLFVLPSLWEGLPLVVLEAMASGCPIVSTAVDGVMTVIEDSKSGLLVPPANRDALSSAILRALEDESLRKDLVEHAYTTVHDRFDKERMVTATEGVYAEILNDTVPTSPERPANE